jgi:hypothetical protein
LTNHRPSVLPFLAFRNFFPLLAKLGSRKFRHLVAKYAPLKPLRKLTYIVDVMNRVAWEIFLQKKELMGRGGDTHQVGHGKDIMSVLSMCLEVVLENSWLIIRKLSSESKHVRI